MSTTTTNYGLIKPDTTDPILVGQLNDNMDTIDTVLKDHSDKIDAAALGIKYKGEVNYYADLPNSAKIGDAYTVKYAGSSGTTPDGTEYVWGTVSGTNQWINFSKDSYTKTEVDALLALKQNALSSAQLAAVNSGIDSTKVAQIEINKNNISLLDTKITQNTSDIKLVANKATVYNYIDAVNLPMIKSLNTTGTWTDNVYSNANVIITVNNDGTLTVQTTQASSSGVSLSFKVPVLPNGDYILIGCPAGGSGGTTNGYFLLYEFERNGTTYYRLDTGDGVVFNKENSDIIHTVRMVVRPSTNIASPIIFKPQIISKSLYDSGFTIYQPYAPTNTELYQMILALQ